MSAVQELFYFTDPMCSWCYGFGPELDKLLQNHSTPFSLTVIPGGLRPYETNPMPERMAREISAHWRHVREASGLSFHFDFFKEHPDFIYDTAPGCRAVNTVGLIDSTKTFAYLKALQAAFYAEGQDPTALDTFVKVAVASGIDAEQFQQVYQQAETELETKRGFGLSQELGIMGYPTLCLRDDSKLYLIARGFLPEASLRERVDVILEDIKKSQLKVVEPASAGVSSSEATGETCEIGPDGQPLC